MGFSLKKPSRLAVFFQLTRKKKFWTLCWNFALKTEIKAGRPTSVEHRHPDDEMRLHFDKKDAQIKSWINYFTIVSGEQQTMFYYRSYGGMQQDELARKLYAEIAEIEEQHVSQYEAVGDPNATPLSR